MDGAVSPALSTGGFRSCGVQSLGRRALYPIHAVPLYDPREILEHSMPGVWSRSPNCGKLTAQIWSRAPPRARHDIDGVTRQTGEINEHMFTPIFLRVSSLRRGHAKFLCSVPMLMDDPRRESMGDDPRRWKAERGLDRKGDWIARSRAEKCERSEREARRVHVTIR